MSEQTRAPSRAGGIGVGLMGLTAATLALRHVRESLGLVHVALVFLLLILFVSARFGRVAGMAISGMAFVSFNFVFIPPYGTLGIAQPLDWLVLVVFLATGLTASQLLHRAEREAALREAARAKDEMLAAVSHDIRTPLTSIRALAHEVAEGGDERGLAIEEEAERLTRFVSDLLDLSRLRAGGLRLAIDINAADDVMGAALQRVSGLAGGRAIEAHVDPADPVLAGRFDFSHTLRIVVNLLENALKYAPAPSPITFTVRRAGQWLEFVVSDRGPGIPPEAEPRLFEAFHRVPAAPPDAGSTGLGLAIARELAQAQGGTLSYRGREGGGSCFTLRLPAVDLASELPTL
jgi:two-component system, OmpR family, sensor histidine kinase KdpD